MPSNEPVDEEDSSAQEQRSVEILQIFRLIGTVRENYFITFKAECCILSVTV